jgi:hypothetical protein
VATLFHWSEQNEVFVVDDLSYTIPAKSGSSVAYIFVFDQSELEPLEAIFRLIKYKILP